MTLGFRAKLLVLAASIIAIVGGIVWASSPALRPALPFALGLALVASLATALLAGHLLTTASRELAAVAGRLPKGDFEGNAVAEGGEALDEIGRSLDRVARELSETLGSLREDRDRLRAVLVGMEEGVLLLDREGRIAFINNALREMLLLGSDAIGKTQLEATKHEHLKQLLDHARTVADPVIGRNRARRAQAPPAARARGAASRSRGPAVRGVRRRDGDAAARDAAA